MTNPSNQLSDSDSEERISSYCKKDNGQRTHRSERIGHMAAVKEKATTSNANGVNGLARVNDKGEVLIELKGNLYHRIKGEWGKFPSTLNLCDVNPEHINGIGRRSKRQLMAELADTEKYPKRLMEVECNSDQSKNIFKASFEKIVKSGRGEKLSCAAILALGMSIWGKTELFAELIGCALPDTVGELAKFLAPPFITIKNLPKLIHCSSRSIYLKPHERSPEPVQLALRTADAVATVLETCTPSAANAGDEVRELVKSTLIYGKPEEDVDEGRGCRVGLLLAGIQKYILRMEGTFQEKLDMCELIIDVSANLLTGVPIFGFAFGAGGSIVKAISKHWMVKRHKEQLSEAVRADFDERFGCSIFLDGKIEVKLDPKKETTTTVKIDDAVFSKWYRKILEWNEKDTYWRGKKDQRNKEKMEEEKKKQEEKEKKEREKKEKKEQEKKEKQEQERKKKEEQEKKKKQEQEKKKEEQERERKEKEKKKRG